MRQVLSVWWGLGGVVATMACYVHPEVSSPHALVGRLLDGAGRPMSGVEMSSIEGRDVTDASGHFAVILKPPSHHVDFRVGDVRYRRLVLEPDRDRRVEVRLPSLRGTSLISRLDTDCALALRWPLGEGFSAEWRAELPRGGALAPLQFPGVVPAAVCESDDGSEPTEVRLVEDGRAWRVESVLSSVDVHVRSESVDLSSCGVSVGGRVALEVSSGVWRGGIAESEVVVVRCDGWPSLPIRVGAPTPRELVVEASAGGPTMDLRPWAPNLHEVVLATPETVEHGGWALRLSQAPDGVFRLPPLPAGSYWIHLPGEVPSVDLSGGAVPPDVLRIRGGGGDMGADGIVGVVHLSEDLRSGTLEVEGP